jgi:hypothetical protein
MYFSKKNMETVEEQETAIWSCSNEGCTCWMRDNYSFEKTPLCPICSSTMKQGMKMLPVLNKS